MSRTYRNLGRWDIDRIENDEDWEVPVNHETTYRASRWLGPGLGFSEPQTFTRQVRYGNFVPLNVRRYKMRPGRRPLGRDGMTNCGCWRCGRHKWHRRQMHRRHRHRARIAIRHGSWGDLPYPYMDDWCD